MKAFWIILAVILLVCVALAVFMSQQKFGRVASGERLERIRNSKNFKNEKFKNEIATRVNTNDGGTLGMVWDWFFGEKAANMDAKEGEIDVVKSDLKNLPEEGDLYVWFGHSSFMLRLSGVTILVDPVFYSGSPVSFFNPMFPGTDYYKPSMMPDKIDYLLVSHDHWDHLDYEVVKELRPRVGHIVCPLGVGEDLECWGYEKSQIVEMDWNEKVEMGDMVIHCLPTRHFTGRGVWNPKTMPASWLLDSGKRKVFYTGDGGYSDRFKRFGETFPDVDLAIMENGQYNEGWNQIHTMPSQLGAEVKELAPERFVTVHHSKFRLAQHAWDEPRRNEQEAARESGVPLIVCKIGEIVRL